MNKEIREYSLSNGGRENWYNNREPWRCINDICKQNLKGDYKILFFNIENCDKFPQVLKFVAFDWENLKVLVYREPQVLIYSFEDYNKGLSALKYNEQKFLSEGMKLDSEEDYKRVFLFKDLDKQIIKELKKGDKVIKQGDFLSTCWGYDQTNVELFIIKKILGKNYLIIQEVAQEIATPNESITYDNIKVSSTVKKIDIPIKAYISNDGYMSVCERGYKRGLSLTDMNKEHYKTSSQFGH